MQKISSKHYKQLVDLRRKLHQNAEISSNEKVTSNIISSWFNSLNPDQVIEGLGGNGLAFIYEGHEPGKTVLLRCALDGLPIQETSTIDYQSSNPLTSHSCGHDGHMTIIAALGLFLAKQRLKSGRVILLFKPAEETGQGARQVVADEKFSELTPDFVFALHNIPKYPFGEVLIRRGAFNCASRGMVVKLKGRTSHAAHPENGISPTMAVSELLVELGKLPGLPEIKDRYSLATVTHVQIGEKSLGVAPGDATIMAVLRAESDKVLEIMTSYAERKVRLEATRYGLSYDITWDETFSATVNDPKACDIIERAAHQLDYPVRELASPFRWSEDFSEFTSRYPGAMFGVGSGENQPQLHNPNFDFPDKLIPIGTKLYMGFINSILN